MEDLSIWAMLFIFLMFVLTPLLFLWAGVTMIRKTLKFNKGAVRVTGTIISVRKTYKSRTYTGTGARNSSDYGRHIYHPTYEYEGQDGVKHQGETAAGASNWNYPAGRQDELMVNANDRTAVRYPGHGHLFMGGVLLALAAVLLGTGAYLVIVISSTV